jgi:TonB family protein
MRLVVRGAVAVMGIACGGSEANRKPDDDPTTRLAGAEMNTTYRPGSSHIRAAEESEPDDGLVLQSEQGTLDQGDVERAIERHWRTMTRCYERAGEAQRYAAGQVTLRFVVGASGAVSDVLIVASSLGNFQVERCLVVEGRAIKFPRPGGGKAAEFEYPIRFQSTGEITVVEWADDILAEDVAPLMSSMTPCPSMGPQPVRAVVYIDGDGVFGSMGLTSAGPIDPAGGVCALEQMRGWKLRGNPGQMVRTSFWLDVPSGGPTSMLKVPPATPEPQVARRGRPATKVHKRRRARP